MLFYNGGTEDNIRVGKYAWDLAEKWNQGTRDGLLVKSTPWSSRGPSAVFSILIECCHFLLPHEHVSICAIIDVAGASDLFYKAPEYCFVILKCTP